MDSPTPCLVEYLWIGTAGTLRSKTRVLESRPQSFADVPLMCSEAEDSYSGEACVENQSEVFLKPRKLFSDPFRGKLETCGQVGCPASILASSASRTPSGLLRLQAMAP